MATAESLKLLGNEAVATKNWVAAHQYYLDGISLLQPNETSLRVILTSNISLVLLQLGRYQEALDEASKCLLLDSKFEKGYIRYATALEALNLKVTDMSLIESCPVMKTYKKGLEENPGSALLTDAIRGSFPSLAATPNSNLLLSSKNKVKSKSSKNAKKQSNGPSKAEREACVALDIRGATGQHELRINGRYDPTDELSGGWPIYKKTIDLVADEDEELDEDDNLILEFHAGLDEWMVKHVSCKGSHRSFVFFKCTIPTRPELCHDGAWQSLEDKKVSYQSSMTVLTVEDRRKEDLANFKKEEDRCKPIEVRGATGRKSDGINGIYLPTSNSCGGWPVYRKITVEEIDKFITSTRNQYLDKMKLGDQISEMNDEEKTKSKNVDGYLIDNKSSIFDGSITYNLPDLATNEFLPINQEDLRNAVNAGAYDSTFVNSSSTVWLEYNPYFRSWQIKPTACLGTNRSWAYSNSNTLHGTLPEQSRGVWEVLEDDDFNSQDSICVMTTSQWRLEDNIEKELWEKSTLIDISGATGSYGPFVNGVYEALPSFSQGYRKRNNTCSTIQYNRVRKLWQLKSSLGLCAFLPDDTIRVLPESSTSIWFVLVNSNWERQPSVKVITLSSRKSMDIEMFGNKLADAKALDVRGATGVNAFKINGVYEPVDEFSGGWPVYQRKGGVEYCLEFNDERGNWQIKSALHKGLDSAFAYVDCSPAAYPQQCKSGIWWVYTGIRTGALNNGWEVQKTVSVLLVEERLEEDNRLYEMRKSKCVPVDIRGASGPRGAGLNGVFDPVEEMRGGWPVYRKRDDGEWWLEYDACPQKWMIRPTACRGSTRGRAYIICDPDKRAEEAKGVWRLSDGKGGWAPEPSVRVTTEAEAVAQDRVLYTSRRAEAVDIDIRGALKPVAHMNGIYEPTDESWHAWPVYRKKGCDSHYIEFHGPSSSWQVKPQSVRGTKRCWAYVPADATPPEKCTKSWMVIVNNEHQKQDSVTVTVHSEQAHNDKLLGNLRRKSCNVIKIKGAAGPFSSVINGIYEPSPNEICGGWPVYHNMTAVCHIVPPLNISEGENRNTISGGESIHSADTEVFLGWVRKKATDEPKSFLVFSPYAMSWAVLDGSPTQPQEMNDQPSGTPNSSSSRLLPANGNGNGNDDGHAPVAVNGNNNPSTTTSNNIKPPGLQVCPTTAVVSTGSGKSVNTPSSSSVVPAETTANLLHSASLGVAVSTQTPTSSSPAASICPVTVAFMEVAMNAQPEVSKDTGVWKVLVGNQFELQTSIKITVVMEEKTKINNSKALKNTK